MDIYKSMVFNPFIFSCLLYSPKISCNLFISLQYLGQRKKQEAEERRIKQKKAREDFTRMLEVIYVLL